MALPKIKAVITADTSQAEAGFDRVEKGMADVGRAATNARGKVVALGSTMSTAAKGSGALQRGVQNASFQVADFAVMVGGGVDASKALAMQLPQLLGGFGMLGAVLGAVVAVGVPLASVLGDMSEKGKDLTSVFGTLQPVARAVGDAFSAIGAAAHNMAELAVNNIDRILIVAGTAAAFFAGKWVVSFAAARIAAMTLNGVLMTLRATLIRLGFTALIIAAGEIVYQFSRLVSAAGTFGEAVRLLWDVAKESFDKIKAGVGLIKTKFQIVMNDVSFAWVTMLGKMRVSFGEFLDSLSSTKIGKAMGLTGGYAAAASSAMTDAMKGVNDELTAIMGEQGGYEETLNAPMKSIEAIRALLAGMKDEKITIPDILGAGEDKDGKTLKDKLSENEKSIKEHFDRIKALTTGTLGEKLGAWGDYFNNLAALTGDSNSKLLRIGKAFAASQALIDAWVAHNRVLADPTLPWWARIASAGQVLAAGIGAVNAIKSVSSSGGGGSTSASSASTAAAPAQAPLEVRLTGFGADTLFSGSSISTLLDRLSDEAGDRGYRLTVAQ